MRYILPKFSQKDLDIYNNHRTTINRKREQKIQSNLQSQVPFLSPSNNNSNGVSAMW